MADIRSQERFNDIAEFLRSTVGSLEWIADLTKEQRMQIEAVCLSYYRNVQRVEREEREAVND